MRLSDGARLGVRLGPECLVRLEVPWSARFPARREILGSRRSRARLRPLARFNRTGVPPGTPGRLGIRVRNETRPGRRLRLRNGTGMRDEPGPGLGVPRRLTLRAAARLRARLGTAELVVPGRLRALRRLKAGP
jgi:hypothetical protein